MPSHRIDDGGRGGRLPDCAARRRAGHGLSSSRFLSSSASGEETRSSRVGGLDFRKRGRAVAPSSCSVVVAPKLGEDIRSLLEAFLERGLRTAGSSSSSRRRRQTSLVELPTGVRTSSGAAPPSVKSRGAGVPFKKCRRGARAAAVSWIAGASKPARRRRRGRRRWCSRAPRGTAPRWQAAHGA